MFAFANEGAITTGLVWNPKLIRIFLVNRWAYAGYVTWGRFSKHPEKAYRVKAEWEPIITEELARGAERGMKERASKPKAAGRPHRFSMMLRCKLCGGNLSVSNNTSKILHGKKITGYICRRRCPGSYVREALLLESTEAAIRYLQDRAQLDALVGEMPPEYEGLRVTLDEARKALAAITTQRQRLTVAYTREAIDIEEFELVMIDLKARYNEIAARVTELEDEVAATPTPDQRRTHLEEIRDRGTDMLHHPDMTTANAWLRQHFLIYILGNRIDQIHLY